MSNLNAFSHVSTYLRAPSAGLALSILSATQATPATYEPEYNTLTSLSGYSVFGLGQSATGFSSDFYSLASPDDNLGVDILGSFFPENDNSATAAFMSRLETAHASGEAYRQEIADTLTVESAVAESAEPSNIQYAVIQPQGVASAEAPLRFTHVAGSLGIMEERVDGETKRYISAHTGIDVSDYEVTQIGEDPRGIREIGQTYSVDDVTTRASENARAQAMFTEDGSAIEELQITVGFDMRGAPEGEEISLVLEAADGGSFEVLDVTATQVEDVRDFLVLVIRDNAEDLAKIHQHMMEGGNFTVESQSILNAQVDGVDFTFGSTFAEDMQLAVAEYAAPSFYFSNLTSDFQRRVAYDPASPEVSHDVQECVFLGLNEMSDEELEGIRVVMGQVTDGTGMLPRDWTSLVALDADDQIVALGSQAWWGVNYETNTVRRSGSSETRYTENGGEVVGGCTVDLVTPIVPAPPMITYVPSTPGVSVPPIGHTPGVFVPPIISIFNPPGDNPYTPDPTPETPAPVPLPWGGALLLTSLLGLGFLRKRSTAEGPSAEAA